MSGNTVYMFAVMFVFAFISMILGDVGLVVSLYDPECMLFMYLGIGGPLQMQ